MVGIAGELSQGVRHRPDKPVSGLLAKESRKTIKTVELNTHDRHGPPIPPDPCALVGDAPVPCRLVVEPREHVATGLGGRGLGGSRLDLGRIRAPPGSPGSGPPGAGAAGVGAAGVGAAGVGAAGVGAARVGSACPTATAAPWRQS